MDDKVQKGSFYPFAWVDGSQLAKGKVTQEDQFSESLSLLLSAKDPINDSLLLR